MICWDDGLSDYPQWRVKAMGDVSRLTGKPVFNSELHLYHDTYAYFGRRPSRAIAISQCLNGEWTSASFAWGQWTKPQALEIHRATPAILADLLRLETPLRAFHKPAPKGWGERPASGHCHPRPGSRDARPTNRFEVPVRDSTNVGAFHEASTQFHVVLSGPSAGDDPGMQRLYTEMANLGCGWSSSVRRRFLASQQEPSISRKTPVCREKLARPWRTLPRDVRIVFAETNALADEYGHLVPSQLLEAIVRRGQPQQGVQHLISDEGERVAPAVCRIR